MHPVKKIVGAALAVVAMMWASAVQAAPITFDITWSGGGATAAAVLTLDNSLMRFGGNSFISMGQIDTFTLTVSGAIAGNGVYGKSDYVGIYFSSATALDLTRELVGQDVRIYDDRGGPGFSYTVPYAVNDDGRTGSFDLIPVNRTIPGTVRPWQIISGGDGEYSDLLQLTSIMSGAGAENPLPAPEPETYALMLAGLALVGASARRRRSERTA